MIIDISVKDKIATTVDPDGYGVCHNGDYIVRFEFDSEWDEFAIKTMRINYGGYSSSVIFSGNECILPKISQPGPVEIGVFAGDLHTTTPATIPFIKSITSANGPEPDPTPEVYAQIIKMLEDLEVGTSTTKDGTVVSPNADFAEVAEWADGNPDNEDRTGYFVCADVPVNGTIMKKATSVDDVKGVSIKKPAFAGNYTEDKLDSEGNLLPKYSFIAVIGFVPVIDNGTCTVGGRCMPDDNGCAIPSSNSMGYQVVNRIDENRVLIIIEPNGDMVQRIKTEINKIQEDITKTSSMVSNAIKGTVSGESVTLTDVSPIEHDIKVELNPYSYEEVVELAEYNDVVANQDITFEGKSKIVVDFSITEGNTKLIPIIDGVATETSIYIGIGVVSVTGNVALSIDGSILSWSLVQVYPDNSTTETYNGSFEVTNGSLITGFTIVDGDASTIKVSEVVTHYVTLYRSGKNIFNAPIVNGELLGITVQYLPDEDCILINGTSTNYNYEYFKFECNTPVKPNSTYAMKTVCVGGEIIKSSGYARCYITNSEGVDDSFIYSDFTNGESAGVRGVTNGTNNISYIVMMFTDGIKFNNYKVRIQLEQNNVVGEYEKYVEPTVCMSNSDGTMTIPSLYPTTILTTDTKGVMIDAEYSKDIIKVLEDMQTSAENKITETKNELENEVTEILSILNNYAESIIGGD